MLLKQLDVKFYSFALSLERRDCKMWKLVKNRKFLKKKIFVKFPVEQKKIFYIFIFLKIHENEKCLN